jgi:hypothetical protein
MHDPFDERQAEPGSLELLRIRGDCLISLGKRLKDPRIRFIHEKDEPQAKVLITLY